MDVSFDSNPSYEAASYCQVTSCYEEASYFEEASHSLTARTFEEVSSGKSAYVDDCIALLAYTQSSNGSSIWPMVPHRRLF